MLPVSADRLTPGIAHCFAHNWVGNEVVCWYYLLALVGLVAEAVLTAAAGRTLG